MRILLSISRILIGAVFIFSGFVKAIDPLGTKYKIIDYMEVFGLDYLDSLALTLSIIQNSLELVIGLCLVLKIRMRVTAVALMIFMGIFLPLTLYIAIANPVTDCGCFGDALILTNWQTFFKNLIFMVPTLIVFWFRKNYTERFNNSTEWTVASLLTLGVVVLSVHCLRNLPMIDFRPFKVGVNIPKSMEYPEGAAQPEFSTTMIYEKDGVQQEFEMDNIPWQDTTWKWGETKNVMISKGYEPPIHDFSFSSLDGYEITDELLYENEYSLLVAAYNLEETNIKHWEKVQQFISGFKEAGIKSYILTASITTSIEDFKNRNITDTEIYLADDVTLKTMVRANPGVMLLHKGNIIGKWHARNIPLENFDYNYPLNSSIDYMRGQQNSKWVHWFYLMLAIVYLLIEYATQLAKRKS